MPDRLLGTDLSEAAAGKPAADRKGQSNPFAGEYRRGARHGPDDGAGIRAGHQPDEKGTGERQIRGLVVQQQPGQHPDRERNAQAGGEDEAFGPVPLFGEKDAAKPGEPDEHRGEHGHDGELHHQGYEQELLGQEDLGFVEHDRSGRSQDDV